MSLGSRCYYIVTTGTAAETAARRQPAPFVKGIRPALRGGDRFLIQTPHEGLHAYIGPDCRFLGCRGEAGVKAAIDHPDWRPPQASDWDALKGGEVYADVRWVRCALPLTDAQTKHLAANELDADTLPTIDGDVLVPVAGDLPREYYASKRVALYTGPAKG